MVKKTLTTNKSFIDNHVLKIHKYMYKDSVNGLPEGHQHELEWKTGAEAGNRLMCF